MRVFAALGLNDLRNVRRDPMLLYMVILPWILVFMVRFLAPGVTAWLAEGFGFRLEPYYPLILSFFLVLQIPMLLGVIIGFLVLDERDDGALTALQVTPVSTLSYVYYRISVAVTLSAFFVIISLPLTGLVPLAMLPGMLPVAVLAGILSMVLAVVMATFSDNKVEGLALMKGFGILMLGPLAAYFINSDWQLVLGILPSYWPAKAFWKVIAGEAAWPYIAVGIIYHLLLLSWLLRRFQAKI